MADSDVKIKVEVDGVPKASSSVGAIRKAFDAIVGPINKVRAAAAGLFKTLGTVSFIVHGISMVLDSMRKLYDHVKEARREVEKLANARMMNGFAAAINKAAERAERLKVATSQTLENLKELQSRKDHERAADMLEKSSALDLEEQRALRGVTDKEQRTRISEDFTLKRAFLESDMATRAAVETRRAIDAQISAATEALGKEERFREGREPDREKMYRAWRNPGKDVTAEEVKKREKMLDSIDKEIAASDSRTRELERLIEALKHQRSLLDKSVFAAGQKRSATFAKVENDRAVRAHEKKEEDAKKEKDRIEMERKAAEAYAKKLAELQAREERKALHRRINAARTELQTRQSAAAEAAQRHDDAKAESRDAWNTFTNTLDPGGRRDMRKEERRAAKQERRFQYRLAKLQAKYGEDLGPTAFSDEGLTLSERATRKVALARAAEKAAGAEKERAAIAAEKCEQHLSKLAENIDAGGE